MSAVDWAQLRVLAAAAHQDARSRPGRSPTTRALELGGAALVVTVWSLILFGQVRLLRAASETAAAAGIVHLMCLMLLTALLLEPLSRPDGARAANRLGALPVASATAFAARIWLRLRSIPFWGLTVPTLAAAVAFSVDLTDVVVALIAVPLLAALALLAGEVVLLRFGCATRRSRVGAIAVLVLVGLVTVQAGDDTLGRLGSASVVGSSLFWVPSTWASNAVVGGPESLSPLLGLALLSGWSWWVGVRSVGAASAGGAVRRARGAAVARGVSRLPGPIGALVAKDVTMLIRHPSVRLHVTYQAILAALTLSVVAGYARAGDSGASAALLPHVGVFLAFLQTSLTLRPLALDGRAWRALAVSGRRLLLSRVLAHGTTFGVANAVVVAVLVLLAGRDSTLAQAAVAAVETLFITVAAAGAGAAVGRLVTSRSGTDSAIRELLLGALGGMATLAVVLPIARLVHAGSVGAFAGAILIVLAVVWVGTSIGGTALDRDRA